MTGVSGSGKSSLVGDILREALARDLNGADRRARRPRRGSRASTTSTRSSTSTSRRSAARRAPTRRRTSSCSTRSATSTPSSPRPRPAATSRAGSASTSPAAAARPARATARTAWRWTSSPTSGSPARSARASGSTARRCTSGSRARASATCSTWTCRRPSSTSPTSPRSRRCSRPCTTSGSTTSSSASPRRRSPAARPSGSSWPRELVKKGTGKTLYILDEPTTGLHFDDVHKLLEVLHGFTDAGQHGRRDRAQPRRGQDGRLGHRPRARGGRRRRPGRRRGDARAGGEGRRQPHRRGPHAGAPPRPRAQASASAAAARGNGRAGKGRKSSEEGLDAIAVRGARQHNLKGIDVDIPRHKMTVCSGPERLGQELAGDRHALRRGPAAIRREPLELRPAVPGPAAEAQGRADQRALAGDQHRAEDDQQEPALDGRHRHRDLRLPAHPLRPARPSPLPGLRRADRHPDGRRDRREDPAPARGDEGLHHGAGRAARRRELRGALGRAPRLGLRPGPGRRQVGQPRRPAQAEPPPQAPDRGRGRPGGRPPVDPVAAGRLGRVGARPGQGGASTSPGSATRPTRPSWPVDRFSQHRSCDRCGRSFEELSPHHFSFNSPLGWCPVCEGLGTQHGANPAVLVPDGRRSLREGAVAVWPRLDDNPAVRPDDRGPGRGRGDRPRYPVRRPGRPASAGSSCTARARPGTPCRPTNRPGMPGFSFQYKGLFPAIEEAARVSFVYRFKLQGMVDDVPCAACMGGRLRDDAAAVRFHGFTLDQISRWPLGQAWPSSRS